MKNLGKAILIALGMTCVTAAAAPQKESFLPENNLDKEITYMSSGGLNEKQFNAVISKVESVYKPIFAKQGATITVERRWNDETVNAYANQLSDTRWEVHMFGGLARRREVSEDGFAMVVCHEFGHHLGGFPFYADQDWAANEGESDYHATIACAAKVFGMNMELSARANAEVPADLKEACKVHRANDLDICYRTILAGKSLGDLMGALEGTEVYYNTPDQSVVDATNDAHPAAQCRLDTYTAGALCGPSKWDYDLIPGKALDHTSLAAQADAFNHSCSGTDYMHGSRPTCWFHPN